MHSQWRLEVTNKALVLLNQLDRLRIADALVYAKPRQDGGIINRNTAHESDRNMLIQASRDEFIETINISRRATGHPYHHPRIEARHGRQGYVGICWNIVNTITQVLQQTAQVDMPWIQRQLAFTRVIDQCNTPWLNLNTTDTQAIQVRRGDHRNITLADKLLGERARLLRLIGRQIFNRNQRNTDVL